jgi:predicted alpha/beta-hydrolase family hydrolase
MHKKLKISLEQVLLDGDLYLPHNAFGFVIFSHGSGSSRFSPRNNFVAQQLQRRNMGTFLFDLLTETEDQDYSQRFNIELLSQRLVQVTKHFLKEEETKDLPIGYFGASTGAASALIASSLLANKISAVVSRGGRPDLAMDHLPQVKAPTLFIVGGLDTEVIRMNQTAFNQLSTIKRMEIIEGATHLFEEPGALEQVAELSGEWFNQYLKVKTPVH